MKTDYNVSPDIIYEDNHILVVNKKSNILTQGDYSKEKSLVDILKDYIKKKYNKPGNVYLGLVHRLDKPVSGILVFAKTSKAAKRLSENFKDRNINKFYIALTENNIISNNKNKWTLLGNNLIRKRDVSIVTKKNFIKSQLAELEYKTIVSANKYSLQLIKLLTGKKHQIRAQFSYQKNPILGDFKYNSHSVYQNNIIALHAYVINVLHPTLKEFFKFTAEIPVFMQDYIKKEFDYIELIEKINSEINLIIDNEIG